MRIVSCIDADVKNKKEYTTGVEFVKLINKLIIEELKPHRSVFFGIFLLILGEVGFEVVAPLPFKLLIDNVLGNEPIDATAKFGSLLSLFHTRESLGFFAVLVFCVSSISSDLTSYFSGISIKKLALSVMSGFSKKAFDNLEKLSVGYYKHQDIGDYIYRLSYDISSLGLLLEEGIIPLATNALYLASTIAVLFFISQKLALVSLAMLPLLILGLLVFNKKIGTTTKASERSNSLLFSFIEEALTQLKTIQAFNKEKDELKSFAKNEDASLEGELSVTGLEFVLNLLIGVVIAIGYAVLIVYGISSVFAGELSTGLLIVFIFYLDNLTNPLLSLMTATSVFRSEYKRVERMTDFFTTKFHVKDKGKLRIMEKTDIVFRGVTIFADGKTPILRDASFTIPEGKKTVIVGVSGSGKTTIASLILRFIEKPDKGSITIGGRNITDYDIHFLHHMIAYVPQEIVLFNDSIKENIAFGCPKCSLEEIRQAAVLADADRFIRGLPHGYRFQVGESGLNLSGGQRQRLMLARAFLKTWAKIIILDEPLASLDIKTHTAVLGNLNTFANGKTLIIISNVLDVVEGSDNIIVVNQGSIVYAGSQEKFKTLPEISKLLLDSA